VYKYKVFRKYHFLKCRNRI